MIELLILIGIFVIVYWDRRNISNLPYVEYDEPPKKPSRVPKPIDHSGPMDIAMPELSGKYMSAEAKAAHLLSDYWRDLKYRRLLVAGHKCEFCGITILLHLHHVNYRNLGNEHIEDVRILCKFDHYRLHTLAEGLYDNPYGRENDYPLSILKNANKG